MSKADEDYAFGLYPDGSGVLRNKLGLREPKALEAEEYRITKDRAIDAVAFPPTKAGYQALHRYLLGDIYEWAGELRTVDFGKGGSRFATARFLDATLHKIFTDLAQQDHLRGRTGERFAEGAAYHISELNVAHPFREGNGRAMRLHLQQLAEQAGHTIDQTGIPKKQWMDASIRGFEGDERPMAAVIASALRPARLISPDAAVAELRDAVDPARDAIRDATRTVRERLGVPRLVTEALGRYRAEVEQLASAGTMAEQLAEASTTSGLLRVNAPASATPRDRAHAILAAASGLPASLASAQADLSAATPDAVMAPRPDALAAYMASKNADAATPTVPTQAASPPASAPDAAQSPRPARRPREPGPGF